MDQKLDAAALFGSSRGRVYLLWAVLVAVGYVATHYFQQRQINGVWTILSIIGLGYMWHVMPMRLRLMKRIFIAWAIPIGFGMAVSALVFTVNPLAGLIPYLGAFWLVVQAAGFAWNGAVDPPSRWYYIVAAANLLAGLACFWADDLLRVQYLVAAVVSAWSMLMLWIFRTE